jgi:hypothetical protein
MVTITVGEVFGKVQEIVVPGEHITTVLEFFESSYEGLFCETDEKDTL